MTSASTSADRTTEYTVIVAVRGHGDEREFLLVRHPERGWELPGGKLEDKEGPVHCALREFREETGHILREPRFVFKAQRDNGTCYVFTGGLGERVDRKQGESVEALRWCRRLPPPEELAFPDDPYEEIEEAMGIRLR